MCTIFLLLNVVFTIDFVLCHLPLDTMVCPCLLYSIIKVVLAIDSFVHIGERRRILVSIGDVASTVRGTFPRAGSVRDSSCGRVVHLADSRRGTFETGTGGSCCSVISCCAM